MAEEVVVQRLQLKNDQKANRLEAQLQLIAPVVDKAERKWAELVDVDHLNFTAIEWEIENELPEPNDRTWRKGRERGRGARGLPAFLGNAVKLFDLKQVVKELETSVMTSVSCSACKAGTTYNFPLTGSFRWLIEFGTRYMILLFEQGLVCFSIMWIQASQRTKSFTQLPNCV